MLFLTIIPTFKSFDIPGIFLTFIREKKQSCSFQLLSYKSFILFYEAKYAYA